MYNKVSLNAWIKWINVEVKPFTLGSVIMSGAFFLLALLLIPLLGRNLSVYIIVCISLVFIVRSIIKVNDFDFFGIYDYKLAAMYFLKPLSRKKRVNFTDLGIKKPDNLPINFSNAKNMEATFVNSKGEFVRIYEVRGNASRMLFEERRNSLLENVKFFYNNLPNNLGIKQAEVSSMHDVEDNVNTLLDLQSNLKGNRIDIKASMIDDEIQDIRDVAAKTKKQYFIAISSQIEKLDELEDLMLANINEEAYFSYVRQVMEDEFESVVKEIFLLNPLPVRKKKPRKKVA